MRVQEPVQRAGCREDRDEQNQVRSYIFAEKSGEEKGAESMHKRASRFRK